MNLNDKFKEKPKQPFISTATKHYSDIPADQVVATPPDDKNLTKVITKQSWYRLYENIEKWRFALSYCENPVLPQRLLMYRVYEEVILDTNVIAQIEMKKDRLKSVNFNLVDIKTGDPLVEETRTFEAEWFSKLIDYWVDHLFWGYTLVQIDAISDRNHLGISKIDPKYIVPERKEYKGNVYDVKGNSYYDELFLDYLIEIGSNTDMGLFKQLAPIVLYKRFAVQNWSQYQETFGMPTVIGKMKGNRPEEVAKLENWVKNLGSRGWGVTNESQEIEFLSNGSPDAFNVYLEMIHFCDIEISKIINGADIHENAGGSFAQAKVKDHQTDIKTVADMRRIEYFINEYIIPKIKNIGVSIPDNAYFKFDKNQKLDLTSQFSIDSQLLNYFDIPASYFIDKYGIPIDGVKEAPEPIQEPVPNEDVKNNILTNSFKKRIGRK